jgi:hypothetical protein
MDDVPAKGDRDRLQSSLGARFLGETKSSSQGAGPLIAALGRIRIFWAKSSGCSITAKWPPLRTPPYSWTRCQNRGTALRRKTNETSRFPLSAY